MQDYATGKTLRAGPEEQVRQDYERLLIDDYGYLKSEIDIEVAIPRGSRRSDRADIVVYRGDSGRSPTTDVVGIVETKKPGAQDGREQLKSYLTATSAEWGVWTNGETIEYFCKPPGQVAVLADHINNIPVRGQRLEDIGQLAKAALKPFGPVQLRLAFRYILNTLYANANISRKEKLGNEAIKLIFAKIRDETTYPTRPPAFRAGFGEEPDAVKRRVDALFDEVKDDLADDGVFEQHDAVALDAKGVAWVVGQLERGSLTSTPTDVVGDAFEVFAESKFVGEKGQFFTPRCIIDVAVRLIDPKPKETVCDPACGSGGFIIAAMRHVWQRMAEHPEWRGLPAARLAEERRRMAERSFFGIDKEADLVRIAKAYMAISGDGRSNIVQENALLPAPRLGGLAAGKFAAGESFRQFDCILTNPPYGTKAKVLLDEAQHFELGHRWQRSEAGWRKGAARQTDPYILFIERCLQMLADGGRAAIVLPETVFHAPSMAHARHYIAQRAAVRAVASLPHNTFRPYCNAKTCLLVLEKGGQQGDVVMATPSEMGHNHQGKAIFRPGTDEIWNDVPAVLKELDDPTAKRNEFVFTVPWQAIEKAGHLMPHYYAYRRRQRRAPKGCAWVSLGKLLEEGAIEAWDGHGSPPSAAKGAGPIPYIRVADIVNWELYRNPTTGVPRRVYQAMTRKCPAVRAGDVLFVRRGSYRIGTVAMASPRDAQVLLTREILTLRVGENARHLTPFYLLALLSSREVQRQIEHLVFIDTTLPNIGERWRELRLPLAKARQDAERQSALVKSAIQSKWEAQEDIERLRRQIGGLVT